MQIKFKFWDTNDGGYFIFAPCIYSLSKNEVSIGLEIARIRIFYFKIKGSSNA